MRQNGFSQITQIFTDFKYDSTSKKLRATFVPSYHLSSVHRFVAKKINGIRGIRAKIKSRTISLIAQISLVL
jgi:hypothetical protein